VSADDNRDDFQDFAGKPSSGPSAAAPGNFTRMFFGPGAPSDQGQAEITGPQIHTEAQVPSPEIEIGHSPLMPSPQEQSTSSFTAEDQTEKPGPGLFTKLFRADSLDVSSPGSSALPPLNSSGPDLTAQPMPQPWPYKSEIDRGNFSDVFSSPVVSRPERAPMAGTAPPPVQFRSSEQPAGFTAMFSTASPGPDLHSADISSSTGETLSPQLPDSDTLTSAPHPLQMVSPAQGTSQATKLFSLGSPAPESLPFQGGPSEYTKIVSSSTLRSTQENGNPSAAPAAHPPGNNAPVNSPVAFPQMPSWPMGSAVPGLAPVAFPQTPSVPSQVPSANLGAWSISAPPVQTPVLMPPTPPQVVPEPPRPSGPAWVTYLPLIIFFNFLFFLIVVLVLIFAFKK